jgi:predicted small secreted protein
MRRIAILVLMVWAVALAGCETMKGFGKDMEKAGETIQKKADR